MFLLEELEEAQLETVNYELLQSQISLAENKGAISELLAQIFARTDQDEVGVFDALYDIKNKLNKIAELSLQFSELNQRFEENYIEIKDTLFQLHNEAENLETNPEDLLALQEQNDRINALAYDQMKKYKEMFEEYVKTVNDGLTKLGKEMFPHVEKEVSHWFDRHTDSYLSKSNHLVYYRYQADEIIAEFFKRYPKLKLNDKKLLNLDYNDLEGYQKFQKTPIPYPTFKEGITPYQIIEKELED